MAIFRNPFLANIPFIDVHGYTMDTVFVPISEFINDNLKLKNYKIVIIHGIGERILERHIHFIFLRDKRVKKIYLDSNNLGCSIVELNNKL